MTSRDIGSSRGGYRKFAVLHCLVWMFFAVPDSISQTVDGEKVFKDTLSQTPFGTPAWVHQRTDNLDAALYIYTSQPGQMLAVARRDVASQGKCMVVLNHYWEDKASEDSFFALQITKIFSRHDYPETVHVSRGTGWLDANGAKQLSPIDPPAELLFSNIQGFTDNHASAERLATLKFTDRSNGPQRNLFNDWHAVFGSKPLARSYAGEPGNFWARRPMLSEDIKNALARLPSQVFRYENHLIKFKVTDSTAVTRNQPSYRFDCPNALEAVLVRVYTPLATDALDTTQGILFK